MRFHPDTTIQAKYSKESEPYVSLYRDNVVISYPTIVVLVQGPVYSDTGEEYERAVVTLIRTGVHRTWNIEYGSPFGESLYGVDDTKIPLEILGTVETFIRAFKK